VYIGIVEKGVNAIVDSGDPLVLRDSGEGRHVDGKTEG
jgi:hypothetical protein